MARAPKALKAHTATLVLIACSVGCGVTSESLRLRHPMGFSTTMCEDVQQEARERGYDVSRTRTGASGRMRRACARIVVQPRAELRLDLTEPSEDGNSWARLDLQARMASPEGTAAGTAQLAALIEQGRDLVLAAADRHAARVGDPVYGHLARQTWAPPPASEKPSVAARAGGEPESGGGHATVPPPASTPPVAREPDEAEERGVTPSEPPPTAVLPPEGPAERMSWYGGWLIPAYLLSPLVAAGINYAADDPASPLGLLGFSLPAIVHFVHGNPGRGAISAAGLAGSVTGGAAVGRSLYSSCSDTFCEIRGVASGVLVAYLGWAAIDMVFLPYVIERIERDGRVEAGRRDDATSGKAATRGEVALSPTFGLAIVPVSGGLLSSVFGTF